MNGSEMSSLARLAAGLREKKLAKQIADDYVNQYLSGLSPKQLLTKDNIMFMNSFTESTGNKSFWLLFNNLKKIKGNS